MVDVDINEGLGKHGDQALDELENLHGRLPDTVESKTGGGGRHIFFSLPKGVEIRSGVNVLGTHIDMRGKGGYVILEPSLHASGANYIWEGSSDPLEGKQLAQAPAWLLDKVSHTQRQESQPVFEMGDGTGLQSMLPLDREILDSALEALDADDRDTWRTVGMAIHAEDRGMDGYRLWQSWSLKSHKFDEKDQARVWNSFHGSSHPLSISTIYYRASKVGWINPLKKKEPIDVLDPVAVEEPRPVIEAISGTGPGERYPQELFACPGILKDISDWANESAHKAQPHLSINAAMAAVSTVLGRRFRTSTGNWPSLFYLNIAKSSAGKEQTKSIIETVLEEADDEDRISGSGYTSGGAVFSALLEQPCHVSVIDEIGRMMEVSNSQSNNQKFEAITYLMEVFGRCGGTMRPQNYSTMGMNAEQRKEVLSRRVYSPALTIMGMSTPDRMFNCLDSRLINDGFINRFLIIHSPVGRNVGRFGEMIPPPLAIKDWAEAIKARAAGDGNLAQVTSGVANQRPSPKTLKMSIDRVAQFQEFEGKVIRDTDRLEKIGLAAVLGRTVEKAMRLSLVCQLAMDPGAAAISQEAAEYAIQYVDYCDSELARIAQARIFDTEFGKLRSDILGAVAKAGARGLTYRDLGRASRTYMQLRPREQKEVIESLINGGDIEWQEIAPAAGSATKRTRKRVALVAVKVEEGSDR